MKQFAFLWILAGMGVALWAEPSAFGAGTLDSANPYGLTESERSIVENRKISLQNQKKMRQQALKIEQLEETIEGLRSVVSSMSNKIGKTGQKLSEMSSQSAGASGDEVAKLQAQINTLQANSEKNYKKINALLKTLSSTMDTPVKKKPIKKTTKSVKKKVKKTNTQLIKSAISDYRAKRYTKAKETFTVLADNNYKPAETNYYLGEIGYYRKNYDEAIFHYKRSVGYYDKAGYMPTLLLHTALSFQNLGDNDNAQLFFNSLLDSYPDSPQANIAMKYLN